MLVIKNMIIDEDKIKAQIIASKAKPKKQNKFQKENGHDDGAGRGAEKSYKRRRKNNRLYWPTTLSGSY